MAELICAQCSSNEFFRIEAVTLDEKNVPEHTDEIGFKCANCGTCYRFEGDGSIQQSSTAPQRGSAGRGNRVTSSVSAANRNAAGTDRKQF